MIPTIEHSGKGKIIEMGKDQWLPVLGVEEEGGINRWRTGEFQGNEALFLYGTITFIKTHRMYSTEHEPYCKLWILVNHNASILAHQL